MQGPTELRHAMITKERESVCEGGWEGCLQFSWCFRLIL